MEKEKILIVIPTLNERENIPRLIKSVLALGLDLDIMFIDDNSTDGTAEFIKSCPEYGKQLFLIERPGKLGLGTAYVDGFLWGLAKEYKYFFEMDGDMSHSPEYVPGMLQYLKRSNAGCVVGSRYVNGVSVINWPLLRLIISYFANVYVKLILNMPVIDSTSGFVVYDRDALSSIPLQRVLSNGYSFQIEMKFRLYKKHTRIIEFPIIFYERVSGRSKLSKKVTLEAFFKVVFIKLLSLLSLTWNLK